MKNRLKVFVMAAVAALLCMAMQMSAVAQNGMSAANQMKMSSGDQNS